MAQPETKMVQEQATTAHEERDGIFYVIAVVLGILSGVLQAALRDALLTTLLVTASTMFLGFMRPRRPWRWTLIVALLVPATMIAANLMNYYTDLTRAGIYGTVLMTFPGIAGAYGGHFGRDFLRKMFGMK